ncbi:MAG: hypothetical protein Q4Q24_02325 [Methanobrevibacter ruminantium]|uniref:hypothetical protein n=1 Tax=Methanobrevibacter ruminantium TaxID=83816 RepID=UPI0026ED652B|nr:hypothetical protein [Methanobrevibacter ruminantium]MCI5736576.1 hypothetical protein [Methanobrevibacter ruminantium]MDD6048727.1 hypothetical protein [Methanobrevibacter ruminantium]MDO5842094.1 hypothetical protein [Methanobrevibacter ruminantium]
MSKSAKSINATLKKVKKLERQGKYQKALKLCDEYLDSTIAETLILLKIDLLVEYYNNNNFVGLINEYKIKLTHFLEEGQEIELLKIYNTLDNYLELKTQNLANEGIVKSYLAGGLLIDNLETILVLNEMVKDNYESIKNDDEFIENKVPQELKNFVENVSKTSYQYLELILENPREQIASSNFNLDAIKSKLRQFLEPKKEDGELDSTEDRIDESLPEIRKEEEYGEISNEISEIEEKSVVTLGEIINPIEKDDEDILETEDKTEFAKEYSIEEEIQGLKEIISYLNDKNQFKKALIYQRRLVKLAREENIKPHREADLKQRTLSDF